MKKIFITLTLLIPIYASSSNSIPEYATNPDGGRTYIGSCALHMDYIERGLTMGDEIAPYIEGGNKENAKKWISNIPYASRDVIRLTAKEMNDEYFNGSLLDIVASFDDLKIFELKLNYYKAPAEKITVVSYGVGGGNGGYAFYELLENKKFKLVGLTFDGDIVSCDERYIFKIKL